MAIEEINKWLPAATIVLAIITTWVSNGISLKHIQKSIDRLEKKQDKYNNLQERTTRIDESCKSAHNRLNEFRSEK